MHIQKITNSKIRCRSLCKISLFVLQGIRLRTAMRVPVCHACLCGDRVAPSLSLCLQEERTEPWYRRTQWGGSSAWLARHSWNRKRDYLPEGLYDCVCSRECVCLCICVCDILFLLGTHSPLCHQGQWCIIIFWTTLFYLYIVSKHRPNHRTGCCHYVLNTWQYVQCERTCLCPFQMK